jgi:hypothetical protein
VFSEDYVKLYTCQTFVNTKKNPDVVWIEAPSGIGRVPEGSTVYSPSVFTEDDDDDNIIPVSNEVNQGEDSTYTEKNKDQDAGVNVSFGDNSDHNTVNIDQRSTFADVIRDLVPIAKEGTDVAKETAVQLLN